RWALDQIAERLGSRLPTALVGHSLGGRAAILAGDAEGVSSVVALNPWVYPSDSVDLTGRRVLVVHGTEDRVADPGRARTVATRLARTATSVGVVDVEGGKHAMLHRGREFEVLTADFVTATLLGRDVGAPVDGLLHGEERVTV
ncbi:MAG: Alpha/beta hydrolase family protein, partial [Marmoricola sp.]|nr:Alpha/beta hydrolase family protein [Marmoricola sp.]